MAKFHQARRSAQELQLKLIKMKGDLLLKDTVDESYAQVQALLGPRGTEQQEKSLFAGQISELYSSLNIQIQSVKLLPLNKNESFCHKLSIKIEMSGKIDQIVYFISKIESLKKPVKIEQLTLKTPEITDTVNAAFLISKVIADIESNE